ncbi:MAG: glutamine--fructose-6-phosphate transaminase (isomerizing) [Alphaproteobacteria bacterium]|nr:glutamine--fructose-6-phosphate transaminase (isomerizing) [Alphaproteobacteria bacterium]
MCGIIGILGKAEAAPILLEGLKRLEYRGYDSAGIATLVNGHIERRRAEGKLGNLERCLASQPLAGTIGIGHTRWATHGVPSEANAHPHCTDKVAVVHNGIIENFRDLRGRLVAKGCRFASDTDSEVIAHLITQHMNEGQPPVAAFEATLRQLEGAFAVAVIFRGEQNLMIGARRGSPLVVGYGEGEVFLGSDAIALAHLTRQISYLDDGDWVVLRNDRVDVRDANGEPVKREVKTTAASLGEISKGNHRHYMLKEIYEQPTVIGNVVNAYFNPQERSISLPELSIDFAKVPRLSMVACGTSFYAASVARYWFERYARLPVDIDIASEFRYREPPLAEGGVALFVSQSGETMDTLAALRLARQRGQRIISVVNVPESSMARESDAVLPTRAGPEIGVASTKAFTTQLATLACLVIHAAKQRGMLDRAKEAELSLALAELPSRAAEVLQHDGRLREIAREIEKAQDVLYIGRGTAQAVAMEGALKLKEISYIHAEGYAAGELKHGPIALISEAVPVVVVAPSDELFEKTASNVQEVAARGGRVVLLSDAHGIVDIADKTWQAVELPRVHPFVAPMLYAIPVQLLAYHVAVLKGTDVDQPRNLAKSVTVE